MTLRRIWMCGALIVLVTTWGLVHAKAEAEQRILDETAAWLTLGKSMLGSAPRSLHVNGAKLRVATGHSEQSVHALLDELEERCRREGGGFAARAKKAFGREQVQRSPLLEGVLRLEKASQGLVACFDRGTDELSASELARRFELFAKDGDLAVLGALRVVRVEAVGTGSFFVATWNEGAVPLWRMFPERGDAPGQDPASIARPRGTERVLSLFQHGADTSIFVYRSKLSPDEAFARYHRELEDHGVRIATANALQSARRHAALLAHGTHRSVLTVDADGEGSLITLMPLDAGPGALRD